jgi:hypothetical protein
MNYTIIIMWTTKAKGGRIEMALKYEGPKMGVPNCPKDLTLISI